MILDYFAIINNTDKSSMTHNYTKYYERAIQSYLKQSMRKEIILLEVGVYSGASLNMWADYFSYIGVPCKIIGVDINPSCLNLANQEKNIVIEIGDQTDEHFLENIISQYSPFDLIIDDGSHQVEHQKFTFNKLISMLRSSGLYIIEDVVTSYWDSFNDLGANSIIEFCKHKVDDLNFNGIRPMGDSRNPLALANYTIENKLSIDITIESIEFHNSTIILHKR